VLDTRTGGIIMVTLSFLAIIIGIAAIAGLFVWFNRAEREIGARNPAWLAEVQRRRARTNAALAGYYAYRAYEHHQSEQIAEAVEHGIERAHDHDHGWTLGDHSGDHSQDWD
jgi:hypothetical protein